MPTSPKTGDLELGRKIATRREELGISRKDLAGLTGLSYPYIAQIETGYRLPSTRHQVPIARALGMSLDELFDTEESPRGHAGARRQRARRASLEDVVDHAAQEIEALPVSVRLEALSRIQLRIMQGVTEAQSKHPG